MGRAIMIIGAGALAGGIIIYSLIECAQTDKYRVRSIPKGAWLLVILLLPVIGGLLWLFFGRPKKASNDAGSTRGRGPDDDPQFLRNLEERRRQQEHERRLQEWENELKRTGRPRSEKPEPLDPDDPRLDDTDKPQGGSTAAGPDDEDGPAKGPRDGGPSGDGPSGNGPVDGHTR